MIHLLNRWKITVSFVLDLIGFEKYVISGDICTEPETKWSFVFLAAFSPSSA
jgi:hypothetical protein